MVGRLEVFERELAGGLDRSPVVELSVDLGHSLVVELAPVRHGR